MIGAQLVRGGALALVLATAGEPAAAKQKDSAETGIQGFRVLQVSHASSESAVTGLERMYDRSKNGRHFCRAMAPAPSLAAMLRMMEWRREVSLELSRYFEDRAKRRSRRLRF